MAQAEAASIGQPPSASITGLFSRLAEAHRLVAPAPPKGEADMWWVPGSPGWGVCLTRLAEQCCGVLFTEDGSHGPRWFAMPRLERANDGTLSGALFKPGAAPFERAESGQACISFQGQDVATLFCTLDGRFRPMPLRRQTCTAAELAGDYFVTIATATLPDEASRRNTIAFFPRQELWKFTRLDAGRYRFMRLGHRDVHPSADEEASVCEAGRRVSISMRSRAFPSGLGGHIFIALDSLTDTGLTGTLEVTDDPGNPGCRLLGNLSGVRVLNGQFKL